MAGLEKDNIVGAPDDRNCCQVFCEMLAYTRNHVEKQNLRFIEKPLKLS